MAYYFLSSTMLLSTSMLIFPQYYNFCRAHYTNYTMIFFIYDALAALSHISLLKFAHFAASLTTTQFIYFGHDFHGYCPAAKNSNFRAKIICIHALAFSLVFLTFCHCAQHMAPLLDYNILGLQIKNARKKQVVCITD